MTSLLLFLSLNLFAQDDILPQIQALNEVIYAVAAEDLSCEQESDCLKLAVGSRACGGPNGYVVTSKNNLKLESLVVDIDKVTNLEDQYNRENNVYSICAMEMPPNVACEASLCTQVR